MTDSRSGSPGTAADATGMQVFAAASWTYRGVVKALPASDPLKRVEIGLVGPHDRSTVAGNFGDLTAGQTDTDVLRITNPLSEPVAVTLAFDYVLELNFGSAALTQAPPPGHHDMKLDARIEATLGGGAVVTLATMARHETLTCPSAACDDRYRSRRPVMAYEYLDFTLDAGGTLEIVLQTTASAAVVSHPT